MAADSGSKYIDWMLSQINDNTYQQAKISQKNFPFPCFGKSYK